MKIKGFFYFIRERNGIYVREEMSEEEITKFNACETRDVYSISLEEDAILNTLPPIAEGFVKANNYDEALLKVIGYIFDIIPNNDQFFHPQKEKDVERLIS